MALCAALLAAGAAGAVTHRGDHAGHPARAGGTSTTTAPPTPTSGPPASATPTTVVTGPPGPASTTLGAGLVTPTDMGGYYRVVPSSGEALLDSSPCLAEFQPSPAESGRALTALLGPDSHSVPTFVEEVASYPGTSSRPVYESIVAALDACSSFSFSFGGTATTARIAPFSIPPVGDAVRVWAGPFTADGSAFTIQLGVVLDGQDVLALIWIDSNPPSDPIMGSFTSTVSLAIGKLA